MGHDRDSVPILLEQDEQDRMNEAQKTETVELNGETIEDSRSEGSTALLILAAVGHVELR